MAEKTIADSLLAMQKRIGEIIRDYGTVSLLETRLAVRFQISTCKALLAKVQSADISDDLSKAVCQQYLGIISSNLKVLGNLESNCISNQANLEAAEKFEMLAKVTAAAASLRKEEAK